MGHVTPKKTWTGGPKKAPVGFHEGVGVTFQLCLALVDSVFIPILRHLSFQHGQRGEFSLGFSPL